MAKVKHVIQTKDGLYRYNRRVPDDCHKAFRKKLWNLSLGRDYDQAVIKAVELRQRHDQEIARLRDPETSEEEMVRQASIRTSARIAELERRGAPEAIEGEESNLEKRLGQFWRHIPKTLENARNKKSEYRQLAVMQAMAFGDGSRTEGAEPPRIQPPSAPVDRMLYDAHRAMLAQRLEELAPLPDQGPPEMRLEALLERYAQVQALRPATVTHYRKMVRKLVKHFGNHPLPHYDRDRLRRYRDILVDDPNISTQTVEKHFAPLKAVWNWAADEYDDLAELQFPRVRMPKRDTSIDDTRWQAFNDCEIKEIWRLLNEAWGPGSKSRITPRRRRAFLMAIRVMLYTGLRPAEVFRLQGRDVEGDVLTIRETKTTGRRIPLSKHIADFRPFLEKDGFSGERESKTISSSLSDYFRDIIRPAGFTNDRHVLYSLKDTLVDRLQRQDGMSDDVIRGIIGHVSGQGKLRHYKTRFGDTPHGMERMREALDAIEYW